MGEIVSELYTLKATIGEIAKTIYKAAEANFSGVPLIMLHDESDKKILQKAMKKALNTYDFIDKKEIDQDSPMIFRHVIVFTKVIPKGRFTVAYIQNGEWPQDVLNHAQEEGSE